MEKPLVLNFREVLQKYDQITAPITLVCAGNRRKEQNTVRKSKGFSWGAAGLSTALFTGPMMADILRSAKPLRQAKYVCMEGADKLVRLPYIGPGYVRNHPRIESDTSHSRMDSTEPRSN